MEKRVVEELKLKILVEGEASGRLIFSNEPLSFWGGYDSETGEVIDRRHPLSGQILVGKILILPGSRGSSTGSGVLLEAIRRQTAPAAILTAEPDHILSLAAILAQELYVRSFPVAVAPAVLFDWAEMHPEASLKLDKKGGFVAIAGNELHTPVGELSIEQVGPEEASIAIEILQDAARWLISRNIPSWQPESLPAKIIPAVARGEVFVLKQKQEALATISLQWSDEFYWGKQPDDAGYVHKLAVRRDFAGQKLGEYLLQWAEAQIQARGRPYVRLDCERDNPIINRYYQGAGFKLCGAKEASEFGVNLYEKAF